MKFQNRRDLFFTVAVLAIIVCAIVLLFFRPELFSRSLSTIISVSMPFIYGIVIAYLLRPASVYCENLLIKLFDKKETGKHRGLFRMISITVTIVLMFVLLFFLIMMILPELINSISGLIAQLPDAITQFEAWIQSLDKGDLSHEVVVTIKHTLDTLSERLTSYLQSDLLPMMESLVSGVTSSFMSILNVVKNFGLGCIISAYFLGSWEKYVQQLKLVVYAIFPKKAADWIRKEAHLTNRMFSGFIHGKLVDSLIMGVICFLFCTITRMPYALLISIIVGVTNIIPFFGPYLGAIPSIILVLTESTGKGIVFLVFIIVLQQVDGNIIGPAIIGDKLGLSGFWILFSILFFGSLWGLVGMLIGVPLFAVLYDLISRSLLELLNVRGQSKMADDYRKQFPPK